MTTDTMVSVALLVALLGIAIQVYNWYTGRKKDTQHDDSKLEDIRTSLLKCNMKLDQVCTTTTDIKTDIKAVQQNVNEIDKRVAMLEQNEKIIWKKIDEISQG